MDWPTCVVASTFIISIAIATICFIVSDYRTSAANLSLLNQKTPIQDAVSNSQNPMFTITTKYGDDGCTDCGVSFRIIKLPGGKKMVTRSEMVGMDGIPMTRRTLYHGIMNKAEDAYADMKSVMRTQSNDQKTHSMAEWLDMTPSAYEVDSVLSYYVFRDL